MGDGSGGEAARYAEDFMSSCDEVSGSLGEMRPEWYDIACGTASGRVAVEKATGTNEEAERLECGT